MSGGATLSADQSAEVRRLTRMLTNDQLIASYVGVSIDAVRKIRKAHPPKRPQGHKLRPNDPGCAGSERADASAAEHGSRQLLRALLSYGARRGGLPGLPAKQMVALCAAHGVAIARAA